MVDWKKLLDEWDKVPDDLKRKIESSFREKTVEKLNLLFIEKPDALRLYEKIIGPWLKPVPGIEVSKLLREAKPIASAMPEGPYKSDFQAMISGLETRILRGMPILSGEVEDLKEWMEKFRVAVPPAFPVIPEEGITDEWLEAVKKFNPEVKPEVDVHTDFTYSVYLNKWIEQLKDDVPMGIMPLKTPPEVEEFLETGEFDGWKWRAEDITRPPEYLEAKGIWEATYSRADLEALKREEIDKIARIKGLSTAGRKEDVIDRIVGAPPAVPPAAPPPAPPPVPPLVSEPSTWEEFEKIFDDLYARDFRVNTKLTASSAEESIRVSEEAFGRFKEWQPVKIPMGTPTPRFGYMDGSQGLWVAFNKTPIPPEAPPPVAPTPPLVAPPERPPAKPPPRVPVRPPIGVGLTKADEESLSDLFLSKLMEGTLSPGVARGHLPEFRMLLTSLKTELAREPREKAVALARSDVEDLASKIVARRAPVRPPIPVVPPEEVPPVVFPTVVPVAPPPGLVRRWGMPFSSHLCPACVGREKPLEECTVLRSPYLDDRLRRLGLPTPDPLFFELCEEDRLKYGGAFEHFPRNKVEYWVGESLAKADIDIATLVGVGITEEYCYYALGFYEENKHLAVQ